MLNAFLVFLIVFEFLTVLERPAIDPYATVGLGLRFIAALAAAVLFARLR